MTAILTNNGQITNAPIFQKKVQGDDKRIRILVLTGNKYKCLEYSQLLKDTYGVNLSFRKPPEVVTDQVVHDLLTEIAPSPSYILREESQLIDEVTKKMLCGLEVVKNPECAPRFLSNKASLQVWKPIWNKETGALVEVKSDQYFHKVKGYIDASRKNQQTEKVFGWDHLFVNAFTGRSNQDTVDTLWGKNSARQLVLADFITSFLFYAHPQTLTYHLELKPKQGVEFTLEMAVGRFMETNKYLSNPNLQVWDLDTIRKRILDEGVFFRASTSRPVKNYFSPL